MIFTFWRCSGFRHGLVLAVLFAVTSVAFAQPTLVRSREFAPGTLQRISDLPAGRFRAQLDGLSPAARQRALEWLQRFHLPAADTDSLHVDKEGGVFYVDTISTEPVPAQAEPVASETAAPVSPFPAGLVLHSRPGAPNVLYLNFSGENVTGTVWNSSLDRITIPAVAFSSDADYSTFNDAEQLTIKRIWQRVAEDFAPFNIDVTTERPAAFGSRTAHALITRNTDADGEPNPSSTGGGVAYVDVFTQDNYAYYRPAWIYFNNFNSNEGYIAEAVSHEIGHNLGLSHDGQTGSTAYYGGHGSGDISWGPIMGTAYNRNVSQWSKGEYYLANNTQNDLAILDGKLAYRPDDHGDTRNTATALIVTDGTNVVSSKPDSDAINSNSVNRGVLERNLDVDVFSFVTGNGQVSLTVNPWIMSSGSRGGNLDLLLELYDEANALVLSTNAASRTYAVIQPVLPPGRYYLYIRNTGIGDPLNSTPSGYTAYASIGQFFISGYLTPTNQVRPPAPDFALTVAANDSAWGSVNPSSGMYPEGTSVQVTATPATFYRFVNWTGDATGSSNSISVVLNTNLALQAVFAEVLTSNHPTPQWWLAAYGYAQNPENAVTLRGSNGIPVWQSYIAGLNPNDPNSQLKLSLSPAASGNSVTLNWNGVTGRVYSVLASTNPLGGFTPVPNAANLPATVTGFTNVINATSVPMFYRLEVRKP